MSDSFHNPTPQFGTAEYASKPANNRCRLCQQPMGRTYYQVNASAVCPGCAQKIRYEMGVDQHAAYLRALAYGIGAAMVGLIGYALIAILLQGWVISYMSIGVGWIVGTAMMKGSNGVGGRRYQIVAALLTYAAVSMAAIPIWIHFAPERHPQKQIQNGKFEDEERKFGHESGQQQQEDATSGKTSIKRGDMAGTGGTAGAGVSVRSALGQSVLGSNWPADSLLWHEDRVADYCGAAVRNLRTVCRFSVNFLKPTF